MKMTSLLKMGVLAAAVTASMGAYADNSLGSITVTGTIISAGCSVDAASIAAPVELGVLPVADFKAAGDHSALVPFSVHLTACPISQAGVNLSTSGAADATNSKLIAVTGVTGLGVAIYNADDTQINLNSASAFAAIDQGTAEATIPLKAAAMSNGGMVTDGEFTATTNFTLSYN